MAHKRASAVPRNSSPSSEPPPSSGSTTGSSVGEAPVPHTGSGSLAWRLLGVVKTIRPHQWVKNVFVLAPFVFAKKIFDPALLGRGAAAFAIFCLLAGAIYTINDIADIEADRQHPVKRHRPIASGRVPLSWARVLAGGLVVLALGGAAWVRFELLLVAAAYFTLNIAYSMRLKHLAYLDVSCIAAGFVLRVVGGGYAAHVDVSKYLLMCTALLALFLGFGKRRHELSAAGKKPALQRAALESYTRRGLDLALGGTGAATLMTYVVYTLDPHTRSFFKSDWLWVSTLFVLLGIQRFLHLVRHRPKAESPTQEMLRDGPFVAIVLLWVVLVMWLVYNLRPSG